VASVGVAQSAPLVIGATGGSGTRVLARIAKLAGYNLGNNVNAAEDALEFYSFFETWVDRSFSAQQAGKLLTPSESVRMKEDFSAALARHLPEAERGRTAWGWKAPRSIYLLPFLRGEFPQLKFIHLVRDGRDMALSPNQNQLRKHAAAVLSWRERLFRSTAERSILLWEKVNLRAADFGESQMLQSYLCVRFEDLCRRPLETVTRVADFLGAAIDVETIARTEITPPQTLGRWRECSRDVIAKLERAGQRGLRRFGYLA
jgi:hypothetical protein